MAGNGLMGMVAVRMQGETMGGSSVFRMKKFVGTTSSYPRRRFAAGIRSVSMLERLTKKCWSECSLVGVILYSMPMDEGVLVLLNQLNLPIIMLIVRLN